MGKVPSSTQWADLQSAENCLLQVTAFMEPSVPSVGDTGSVYWTSRANAQGQIRAGWRREEGRRGRKAKRKNKEEPVSWSWAFHLWNRKRGTGKVWVTRRCPVDAGDTLGLRLPWRVGRRQRITGSGSHVARAEGSMAGMHHKPASVPWGSQWGISSPEVIPIRGAWTPPWKKGPAGAPASAGMSS